MWMSDILIVVNSKNVDLNGLHEIAGAVQYLGASQVAINEENATVTATVPSSDVATIHLIEGVSYVRPTLSWFRKTL